jgi:hypothetical protein
VLQAAGQTIAAGFLCKFSEWADLRYTIISMTNVEVKPGVVHLEADARDVLSAFCMQVCRIQPYLRCGFESAVLSKIETLL